MSNNWNTKSQEPVISADQVMRSVREHLVAAIFLGLVVMAAAVAIYLWLPRSYSSTGQLYIQLGRANTGVDPSPDKSRSVAIQDTRETEILSVVELLQGNGLLTDVVKQIGAERILANEIKLPPPLDHFMSLLPASNDSLPGESLEDYETLKTRERAVKKLGKDLKVEVQKKTSVISVYCEAASPSLAKEIVDAAMQSVQKLHVSVHAVAKSRDFFETEFALQEKKLNDAEQALRDFRNKHAFLSVDEARATLNGVIAKLENDMVNVRVDLAHCITTIDGLKTQANSINQKVEVPTIGMESSSTESAQTQLNLRLAEKARLLTTFTETDPRVVAIDREIAMLQKNVSVLPKDRKQSAFSSNPVYENLQIALVQETARARAIQAKLSKIMRESEDAKNALVELNDLKLQEDQLQREIRINSTYLDIYANKRGEATVIDRLDQQRISDVVIAQAGSLMLKKVKPKGSLVLAAGFVMACMFSLTLCIWLDREKYLGSTYSSEQIEADLDLPVLVSIPRVRPSKIPENY